MGWREALLAQGVPAGIADELMRRRDAAIGSSASLEGNAIEGNQLDWRVPGLHSENTPWIAPDPDAAKNTMEEGRALALRYGAPVPSPAPPTLATPTIAGSAPAAPSAGSLSQISPSDPAWRQKIAAIDAEVQKRAHAPLAPSRSTPPVSSADRDPMFSDVNPDAAVALDAAGTLRRRQLAAGGTEWTGAPHKGLDENGQPVQYGSISITMPGGWQKGKEDLSGLRAHAVNAPAAGPVGPDPALARLAQLHGAEGHIFASPDTSLADAMRDDARFRDQQEAEQLHRDLARAQVQQAIGQAAAAGVSPYALEAYKQSGEYKKALDMERLKGEYGLAQEHARQQAPAGNVDLFEHEMAPLRAQYQAAQQKLLQTPPSPERDRALANLAAEYDHQEQLKKQLILRIPDPQIGLYATPPPTPGTLAQ